MLPSTTQPNLADTGDRSGLVFFAPSGHVVYANDRFRNLIPLTKDGGIDTLGKSPISTTDRKKIKSLLQECLKAPGIEKHLTHHGTGKDLMVEYRWQFVSLADQNGSVLGIHGEGTAIPTDASHRMRELLAGELLENVADAIVLTDPEFRIIIWNRTAEVHYGIPATEAVGKQFNDIIHFEQPTAEYEAMQHALKTNGEWHGEVIYTRKNGDRIVIWIRSKLVKDQDGSIIGFLGVGRDITDMRHSAQTLQERAGLLQNLSEAVAYMDLDMRIHTINQAGEALFGVTQKEALGRPMLDLVNIQLPDGLTIEHLGDILDTEKRWQGDFDLVRPDGRSLHLHGNVVTLQDNNDATIGYLAVCRDISHVEKAEEDLRLRSGLLENMSEAVVFTDKDSRIISLNSTAEALFGLRAEDVIGEDLDDHFRFTPAHGVTRGAIGEALLNGGSWDGQAHIKRTDGTDATLNLRIFTIWGTKKEPLGFLAFARDISELGHEERQKIIANNVLNSITEGVYSYGIDGKINSWNKAMETIYGVAAEDAMGKVIEDLVSYEILDGDTDRVVKDLTETGKWSGQVRVQRPDGRTVLLDCNTSSLPTQEGSGFSHLTVVRDITSIDESLRRQHDHDALLNNLEDLVISTDVDFNITAINRATEKLISRTEKEVIGKLDVDVIPYTFLSDDLWKVTRILKDKGRWQGRVALPLADGTLLYFSSLMTAVTDAQGWTTGYVEVHRNITERMEAEKRDRYNAILLNNIEDAVIAIDHEFRIVSVNKAAESMYDLRAMDVVGTLIRDTLPWELLSTTDKAYQNAIILSGHWAGEAAYQRKDGTRIFLSAITNRITGDQGEIVGFVTVSRDITSRKEEEQRQQYNSLLMKSLSNGVISLSPTMEILSMNPAAEGIFNLKESEVKGKVFIDLISLNFFDTHYTVINKEVIENGSWNGNCRFRRDDGRSLTLNMTISKIMDEKGAISGFVTVSRDITDRIAEDERRRLNSLLLDNITDGVVALDMDARILSMNPAAETLFGVKQDQVIGHISHVRLPLEYLDSSLEANIRNIEEYGAWHGTVRYKHEDGRVVTLNSRMNSLFDGKGMFTNLVCLFTDISATIEEAQRQRGNDLIMRSISDVIVSLDKDMTVATMNPGAEIALGRTLDDIKGRPVMDVLPLDFPGTTYEAAMLVLMARGNWRGPTIYQHPSGHKVNFLTQLNLLHDDSGKISGVVGVHHDITDKHAKEEQARFSSLLLDNMSDGVVSMAPDLTILAVNKATELATGYTQDQLVGRNANEMIPLEFVDIAQEEVTRILMETGHWDGRARYRHPDGHVDEVMTSVNRVIDEQGNFAGVVTVNRNITAQVEEEKRQQYNMLLMRNIREVIVATDPEYRVTYMNPWAEQLLGQKASEVIGKVAFEVMPLNFVGSDPATVFGKMDKDGEWEGPTLYAHPDGRSIPFQSRFSYLYDDAKKVTGMLTVCSDQTARQEADRQYKYNTLLLDSMTDAVVTLDRDLNVLYMNPSAERLSGMSLEDIKGRTGVEIMAAEYVGQTNEIVLSEVLNKGIWTGHSIYTRPDGQKLHLLTTFNVIKDEKGEFDGIIAVNKDITGEIANDLIRRTNSRILESMSDAVVHMDVDLTILYVNPTVQQYLGLSLEELVGKKADVVMPLEYLDTDRSTMRGILASKGTWTGNTRFRNKDGSVIPLSTTYSLIRNEQGEPTSVVAVSKDISQQKAIEETQRYNTLLMNNISDGVISLDSLFRVVSMNPAAERIFGDEQEAMIGRNVNEVYDLEYIDQELPEITRLVLQQGVWSGETILHRRDGTHINLSAVFNAIRDQEGKLTGFIGTFRDITERVENERRNRLAAGLMERISDAVAYYDQDLHVLYLNATAEDMLDVRAPDVLGKSSVEAFHFNYMDVNRADVIRTVKDKGYWFGDAIYSRPDGRVLQLHMRHRAFKDKDGTITGYISNITDVTESAEKDRQLRFNALLLDRIGEGVVASDKEFKVLYMNPAAQDMTGIRLEEVKGLPTTEAIDLYYPGIERKEVLRLIRETGFWTGEASCVRPDGTLINMILTHARFMDEKGQDAGFITVGRDITELRRTWDKLEDMSLIAQQTQNSVIISDELERIVWVNEGFTRLTGYSWQEAAGKTSIDLLTGPGTDADTIAYIRKQLTRHEPLDAEYRLKRKDGSYRWIRVEGQPVFDANGVFKKYFRIQTDIQEAKEHLAEVETLSLIAKHTDNMVVITDEQDRITWINDAFIRVTGYDLVDAAGETTFSLMAGPDSSQERNDYVKNKVGQHEPFRLEVLIYTKDGHSRWCALEARPIFDESGRFSKYFRMFADIQERKDHEKLLADSQKRLEDLFNTRFEAMAILDREGRVLNMNARAEETSHRKKEELIGKFPWDHDFTRNNHDLSAFFRRAVDTCKQGKVFHETFRLDIPGGGIEVQVFSFRPVMDAFGNLDYIQMEVEDVTEKETAKRTSRYNEQLFNAYMTNSPVPAWITSIGGRIENMNERFLEFIGKDESVIGMNMIDVIDHTYLAQYRQHNEVVVKTQKPLQAIEYALDKDKVVHTFLNTRFPIFEDGKLTKIGGMGMDITSILKAEEERNESIKRFEAVSRATDDMIWEWDVARDRMTWQGENKRNWEHELRTGDTMRHFLEYLHKDDRDMVDSSLRRAVKNRNKDRWQAEYRMKGPDGSDIHILDRAVILRDIEGNASRMIGAMQDITDRVNLEKDFMRQQEEEHKRTTRMIFDAQEAERSRLAADLHDNVNPLLAAARLHINAAEATTDDPAPYLLQSKSLIHEGIEEIRKISHNLSNTLINEIGLEDLVLSTLRKLNPDESMEVHTDFRKLDALKAATSMKLNVIRIIQEQVHNTLKYAQASNLYIRMHCRDKVLYLTIQDDGVGFDPKALRTGIGLANIKNRVESYNGRMKLSSSPGKGCKMEIQLPVE